MLANELIDQLERRGLLDQEIIEALREQLDQGGARVTPEAVAKLLVDNGQLTRFQATKLIGELRSGEYAGDAEVVEVTAVDDLGIADDSLDGEVVEVMVDDDAMDAVPVEAFAVDAMPVEAVAVEAMPVEAVPVNGGGGDRPERPRSRVKKADDEKSQWDSFKIYGYVFIIGFLVLVGGGLWFLLSRGSADDHIALGDKLYTQQNYTAAQERYEEFLDRFGQSNQYSSRARTNIAMSELFRAKGMSDPTRGLELAKEILPKIESEEGLNDQRNNLAGLLVDIAENIANAADEATITSEKETLLGKLDEQMELTQNGAYVTSTMRTALAGRLAAIEESQKRVERDINRNIRLDSAVDQMTTLLDEKKTKDAYDIRFELLRDFPELADNERLVKLIGTASDIQKTLVEPAGSVPKSETAEEVEQPRTMVLTARSGGRASDLRDEVLFLRSKGSVLGFKGEDGTLLWRRYVGSGRNHSPVRLEGGVGVLLSESTHYQIERCDGFDGKLQWRSVIGEPFNQPEVERDDIYVTTQKGRLIAIDAITGDAKWAQQIPQNTDVAPGVDGKLGRCYLPGDHSNVYVLNSKNGQCTDSYYLGHAAGTIAVPPVPLLGHVFVVENRGADFCLVHILGVNEQGDEIRKAQDPVRMTGNVIVPPIITQQRRVIVLTDRGQVSVFDVEPTATSEQVSVVAKQVASYDTPTLTQMAVGRSQMWITGTRIGRYELQINKERVVADWLKHEGDTFIGQPFASDETLVHARVQRGTSGLRVTAVDPVTGKEIWRNDVGASIVMLRRAPAGVHALTSQAALFELDAEALKTGATRPPLENRGAEGITMRFEDPLDIDENRVALVNQESGQQVIVYDPSRPQEKLRLVSLNLPDGSPNGGGMIAGGGLFLPLDSGRAVVMNFLTGAPLGSPFQPVSDPVGKVTWTNPVRFPEDPDQVVIADSRKGIYRLRVGDRINDLASGEIETPLLGTVAGVGNVFIGATSGPAADFMVGYEMNGLKEKFRVLLDGRVTWGPVAAGDIAMVMTADNMLRGITVDGKVRFSVQMPKGKPVGEPVAHGSNWVLIGQNGWVNLIDPTDGKIVHQQDVGQPFFATPLMIKNSLLVPGEEGVVYVVSLPEAN
ncbi:outer membrane protein assembly factor BamB family protein [Stieleria varia]|uniref:Outer membrane biogenesis protein BamB n=1 Tax=Stieleria varia TaxID=2528005 RepID=A0A5C6B8N3_9BACT|nr:PQQ-binding-like beta-propeller repeat protein [Stieleria varia]TWU08002.1 outer membrane biogenesis protein BamB [Stieleria varia]